MKINKLNSTFFFSIVSVVLSQCSPVSMTPRSQISLKIKDKSLSTAGFQPNSLNSEYCYALNITGPHSELQRDSYASSTCGQGQTAGVGLVSGLHRVGSSVTLEVPSGANRKFELIAFPKAANCEGTFRLEASAPGIFTGYQSSQAISGVPRLIAQTTTSIAVGPQTVELTKVDNENAQSYGQPYTCGEAPSISEVVQVEPNAFIIRGTNLEQTQQVALTGPTNLNLSITSATANELRAVLSSSAQVVLQQIYTLLVSNAYGQSSSQVTLTLAPESVKPEHLDMTSNDWPFIPVKPIPMSEIQALSSFTPVPSATILPFTGATSAMFDKDPSTGVKWNFNSNLSPYSYNSYHGVIQLSQSVKNLKLFVKMSLENISHQYDYTINCAAYYGSTISTSTTSFTNYPLTSSIFGASVTQNISAKKEYAGDGMYLEFYCGIENESASSQGLSFDLNISELRVYEEDPFY